MLSSRWGFCFRRLSDSLVWSTVAVSEKLNSRMEDEGHAKIDYDALTRDVHNLRLAEYRTGHGRKVGIYEQLKYRRKKAEHHR